MECKIINKTMERTYRGIKQILRGHIKNGINSLWTWEDDHFSFIFNGTDGNERIYTANQLLKLLS
jgi:hypothetical protein